MSRKENALGASPAASQGEQIVEASSQTLDHYPPHPDNWRLKRNATLHELRRRIATDTTRTLTATTFLTAWTLLSYMGREGEAFPSMATLATETGFDERTIRDHLDRVVAAGLIEKKRDGRRKTNVYQLRSGVSPNEGNWGGDTSISSRTPPQTIGPTTPADGDQGVVCPLSKRVSGSAAQSDRVRGLGVTGVAHPTIQIDDPEKEPKEDSFVRSRFTRSDDGSREKDIRKMTLELFNQTHGLGRKRSRKSSIARELRRLADDGVDLDTAVRGAIDLIHSDDAHNPDLGGHAAVHRILRERRWEDQSHLEGARPSTPLRVWVHGVSCPLERLSRPVRTSDR